MRHASWSLYLFDSAVVLVCVFNGHDEHCGSWYSSKLSKSVMDEDNFNENGAKSEFVADFCGFARFCK